MKKVILSILCAWISLIALAQDYSYSDIAQKYPLVADNGNKVVSGFISLSGKTDKTIFANALLWTVENVSPKMREGINNINFTRLSFDYDLTLKSDVGSKSNNVYYCKVEVKVNEGKLVYYISDILVESPILLMKKVVAISKLQPEKKDSHKQTVDDFVSLESRVLNQLFDYVSTHKLQAMNHWDEIKISKATKGMNEDECRLAFGKPQAILENENETQWMYNSSFYLFFKNGVVSTFIK
jgi:hypothetical protein